MRPKQIAEIICTKNLLPKDTVTARQVSNWIAYHKRNKTIKTPPVTGPNVQADWNDNCKYCFECSQIPGQNTAVQNSGPPPLPPDTMTITPLQQPLPTTIQPEFKNTETETDFIDEYKARLKHLGLYVEASTTEAYHLFLKKLPNTTASITIQNSTSIFVVWSISAPDNASEKNKSSRDTSDRYNCIYIYIFVVSGHLL
jgi:hypothetical protein